MKSKKLLSSIYKFLLNNPVVIAVIIMFLLMLLFVPSFATMSNLTKLAQQISYTGIAVVGLAFVLIGGGNDLSMGANITFTSIMAAILMTRYMQSSPASVLPGILIAMLFGILIGLLNGVLVAKVGVNAFMMTLIIQMLLDGISLIITGAKAIGGLPEGYIGIGTNSFLGVPIPIVVMLIFFILGQFVLKKTSYGRMLYVTGANKQAARLVGIPVERILIIAFAISGFCASCGGIILSARLGAATPSSGSYIMLDIMSAAIIGGNSLFGGKGSVFGGACGVLLLGLISNGLNLLGVSYNATMIVKGVIILLAVALDYLNVQLSSRRLLKG